MVGGVIGLIYYKFKYKKLMYTYKDIVDKSKDGIKKEVSMGLGKIAFYFLNVLGIPPEVFEDWVKEKTPTDADKLYFYMNFRNEYPDLFKK